MINRREANNFVNVSIIVRWWFNWTSYFFRRPECGAIRSQWKKCFHGASRITWQRRCKWHAHAMHAEKPANPRASCVGWQLCNIPRTTVVKLKWIRIRRPRIVVCINSSSRLCRRKNARNRALSYTRGKMQAGLVVDLAVTPRLHEQVVYACSKIDAKFRCTKDPQSLRISVMIFFWNICATKQIESLGVKKPKSFFNNFFLREKCSFERSRKRFSNWWSCCRNSSYSF